MGIELCIHVHPDAAKALTSALTSKASDLPKIRLTAPKVEAFRCPSDKAQAFIWDSDTPGLGVRATPRGKPAYVFQSRYQGRDLRITIGATDIWPLNSRPDRLGAGAKVSQLGAREEARRLQAIIDSGRDPREVKAEVTAADVAKRALDQRQSVTVGQAWAEYLADRKPHWGARHYADHAVLAQQGGEDRKRSKGKTREGPIYPVLSIRLADLTAEWLERWATKEAKTRPASARLGLRIIKAFLRWCSTNPAYRDIVKADAASSKRIREKLGTAEKRSAVLQKEQLPAWFKSVRAHPNPVIAAYLQFMLLAGPRPNEPLGIKWSDISFQWNTVTIRDKIEGTRQIGLTPYVSEMLSALPRVNEWVFSSPSSKSGRLVDPSNAHNAACAAAGLPRITLQGLRRSFASLCEWIEVPAGISAQIQGHAPQGVREQNYIRRPLDLLAMWHGRIENWMLVQAGVVAEPVVDQEKR